MENPHEQVQNALLSRIINNMENLNESVVTMNKSLKELNKENVNSEMLSQMWENYSKNSQFNLETTGQVQEPM